VEGTNTGRENAEGMASVGVRLTAELGHGACTKRPCPSSVMALPLPERWRAPMGGQHCMARGSSVRLECPQKAGKLRVHVEPPVRLGANALMVDSLHTELGAAIDVSISTFNRRHHVVIGAKKSHAPPATVDRKLSSCTCYLTRQ
jgi:hypothetical protein